MLRLHIRPLHLVPALLLALLGLAAAVSAVAADAGDVGSEGPSFSGAGGSPSGSKPESKVWQADGLWWSVMWNTATSRFEIFRLNTATEAWSTTGTAVDGRASTRADALWTGSRLYVASHVFTESTPTSGFPSYLYRYSYNAANDTYSLDPGFPALINNYKTETLVIDRDSTGRLWATWTQGKTVYVNRTTGSDASWGVPFPLPVPNVTVTTDDISSIIAFGGSRIGVLWSNQAADVDGFAWRNDGDPDTTWRGEVAVAGSQVADDHVNLAADAAGRVYAAVKTSHTSAAQPQVLLLTRSPNGTWTSATVARVSDSWTRPIVLVDSANGLLRVYSTGPKPPNLSGQSGGLITEKTAPLGAAPAFAVGAGTAVMVDASSDDLNNVTSTKQAVTAATGLVLLATNDTTRRYFHRRLVLGDPPPPPPAPVADFSGSPLSGTAPLVVGFADLSTGSPTSWAWDVDGNGTVDSTAQNPTITYATAGTYTVALTVANATGSDTRTRVGYVTVSDPPTGSTVTFTPLADAHVKSTSATSNYGTATTLRVRDGTATSPDVYRSYLRFDVGSPGPITAATLRLFVTDASPDGGVVHAAGTGWTETGITWANQPGPGAQVGAAGATTAVGTWLEIAIDPAAIGAGGARSFVLQSASSNSAIYESRQGTHPPELVLTLGSPPPPPPAPVADFSGSPLSGTAPLVVAFLDASTGSPTSWAWDVDGNGSVDSTAQNPTITYTTPGTYTVSLTVANAGGPNTLTRTGYVTVAAPPSGSTLTFTPAADAQVKSTSPTTSYGALASLRLRAGTSPTDTFYASYLRFDLAGVTVPVVAARLRLYVTDVSPDSGTVYPTSTGWTEAGLTWSTRPAASGAAVGSAGASTTIGTWVEIDLDPAVVAGNGPLALLLESASSNSAIFDSREGANPPQLVITLAP